MNAQGLQEPKEEKEAQLEGKGTSKAVKELSPRRSLSSM
jgi:hypothetical protein